ncbi:PEP-utilizing enzyme [Oceanirhabdus sp. W0125-5]|uniref:PEP-utilizing enzyme n=1 Tax=Oceanirhabdus sp. W0125-5 TaxID=2999116 RepID=UPI0022F2DCE5|nr:PEP-utilizing enzyme [Oceanirhabdus sp. W0125-5]WBW94868.1 PEP-utilizing enzyme [Oceanirhabdus sp. W0125-5]
MSGYQNWEKQIGDLKLKELYNRDKVRDIIKITDWDFASKNEDDDFHTDVVFLQVACGEIEKEIGDSHEKALIFYNGYCGEFYFEKNNTKRLCNTIIKKILNDQKFRLEFNDNIYKVSDDMMNVFHKYERSDLKNLSNKALLELYKEQLYAQIELYKKCWIAEIIQVPEVGLTDYLVKYLKALKLNEQDAEKAFYDLCRCNKDSVYVEEEKLIIKLAEEVLHDSDLIEKFNNPIKYLRTYIPKWLYDEIISIRDKYGYLGYHGFADREPYSIDIYLERIKEYVINPSKIKMEIKKWSRDNTKYKDLDNLKEKIDNKHLEIFEMYGELAVSKAYRRLAQLKNFYYLDEMLGIFSRRLNIPESTLRFLLPEEVIALFDFKLSDQYLLSCNKRSKEMAFLIDNKNKIILNDISVKEIKELILEKEKKEEKVEKILKGRSACMGVCRGRAVVVERNKEVQDFNYGDILVSLEADPDLIPIMKKAGAIVTDQGGITCHAAVIAREFNIPCVIGTIKATKMIKNGDNLFVDANKGEVTIV